MKGLTLSVSVIIPNFNGEELLKKNLPKVLDAYDYKPNNISEVIIVDDNSRDGSVELIKERFPQVKLVKHKKNRGFSAAVNTGVRASSGRLVVLLNSDVVPEKDFLVSMEKYFEDRSVFGVSLHEKGHSWAKGLFKDGYVQIQPGEEINKSHISFWVNGGSGVFRREYWIKLGGVDEKLLSPFYWEDIDLCYRALKRGYKILWDFESHVTHEHESTIGKFPRKKVERIMERNQLLFIWKNLTSKALFSKHIVGVINRITKSPGYLLIVFMALFRLKTVLKARKKEIKEVVISDEAIFARFRP